MAEINSGGETEVCILFDTTSSSWGGGNQFLRTLASELIRLGCQITQRPTANTTVVLLNAFLYARGKYLHPRNIAQMRQTGKMTLLGRAVPLWLQMRRERKGPTLIHRVDGVPELVRGRKGRADEIQAAVNMLTDHTVFQTEYCKDSFARHCGITPASSNIINNAVDPNTFFPNSGANSPGETLRLVAVSWSPNRRKGFDALADVSRLPGVELTFVGNWCPEVDPANVILVGVHDSTGVSEIMRSSHAMIHAAWEEPCSNAIVEAMACGLPVIYRDSGGSRELAGEYGITLSEDPAADVENLREQYVRLREKVLHDRPRFLINRAATEYLSMFREAIAARQEES